MLRCSRSRVEYMHITVLFRCLYISGVPGTGKTATVFEVMRYLNEAKGEESIPDFKFIAINGMKLTQPHQAFVQIYKVVKGSGTQFDSCWRVGTCPFCGTIYTLSSGALLLLHVVDKRQAS